MLTLVVLIICTVGHAFHVFLQKPIKVGRPCTFPLEKVLSLLLERKSEFMCGRRIASKSDDVWKKLADITKPLYNMSANYLYTIIQTDRHGIRTALLGHYFPDSGNESNDAVHPASTDDDKSRSDMDEDDTNGESDNNERDTSTKEKKRDMQQVTTFMITLSAEEWKSICPESVQYSSRSTKRPQVRTRHYLTLKRNVWSNVINEHFWKHTRLPCALRYRSSFIRSEDDYILITGQCSFCCSKLTGAIAAEPLDNEDVEVDCRYVGNFSQPHPTSCKRRLSGSGRRDAINKL